MNAHDTLFKVYRSASRNESFGLGETGPAGFLMVVTSGQVAEIREVSLQEGVKELALRLKQGFISEPQKLFFNSAMNEFQRLHPDLDLRGSDWLLAATSADIATAVQSVVDLVRTMPATIILPEEINAWQRRQLLNAVHVTAFKDLPVWALALAEKAYEKGWPLRVAAKTIGAPSAPPSRSPHEWRVWLSGAFKDSLIAETQDALGWTVEDYIISGKDRPVEGDLSAFL